MKKLALAAILLPILVMANETIESDSAFATSYMQQFKNGMSLDDVRNILLKKKKEVQFYNNCIEEFQYPMEPCDKGYNLVTTIKLPGYDASLGKGDLQMYFTFTDKQILVESFHELYYPSHH